MEITQAREIRFTEGIHSFWKFVTEGGGEPLLEKARKEPDARIEATHYRKPIKGLISFVAVGLLLGHNMSVYQFEELLICWLFFSVVFVWLALVILAGILVFYAGECVIDLSLCWRSHSRMVDRPIPGPPTRLPVSSVDPVGLQSADEHLVHS